jgi:hypothetical protein
MRAEYAVVLSGFLLAGCAGMGSLQEARNPGPGGDARVAKAQDHAMPASLTIDTNSGGTDLCEAVARGDAAYGSYDPQTREHVHVQRLAQCRALMGS